MCRNITELRGLRPPATDEEVQAAARRYVRKAAARTTRLLPALPGRRQPDKTDPALRHLVSR